MSAPFKNYSDPVNGIASEIVSAESALNMPPRPMDTPKGDYLSEQDEWVAHAMEHLHEAFALVQKVEQRLNHLHGLELYVEALLDMAHKNPSGTVTLQHQQVQYLERAMKYLRALRPTV